MKIYILFGAVLTVVNGLDIGDKCTTPEGDGVCKGIRQCDSAIREIRMMKKPTVCAYETELIVCCVEPQVTTTTMSNLFKDRMDYSPRGLPEKHKDKCDPIANNVTAPIRKSLQKCLEYQERLVYPCQESLTPNEGMVRNNRCNWKPESLIIGGVDAYRGEFPHMVHLGFGKKIILWQCAGILVSDRFVLTAGHCTYSRNGGAVTKIRIAFLKKSEELTDMTLYDVKQIYKHPDYKPPSSYNDIALLETDRPMYLNKFAVPACLHDGSPINDTEVYATGWGITESKSSTNPDNLQKVVLQKFSADECIESYQNFQIRSMPRGFDRNTQLCYGHRTMKKDSCQGDSGGPVQIIHPELKCMYLITGVISTGKWCAVPGLPGFNTRVATFIDWIESIVWP